MMRRAIEEATQKENGHLVNQHRQFVLRYRDFTLSVPCCKGTNIVKGYSKGPDGLLMLSVSESNEGRIFANS